VFEVILGLGALQSKSKARSGRDGFQRRGFMKNSIRKPKNLFRSTADERRVVKIKKMVSIPLLAATADHAAGDEPLLYTRAALSEIVRLIVAPTEDPTYEPAECLFAFLVDLGERVGDPRLGATLDFITEECFRHTAEFYDCLTPATKRLRPPPA
jgi:hypothetical protein